MSYPSTDEQAPDAPASPLAPPERRQAPHPGTSVVCSEAEFLGTMLAYMRLGVVPFGEAMFSPAGLHIRSSA